MLLSYSYGWWQNWWWGTNVPPLLVILLAMRMRGCKAAYIAQCSMSMATPKASGCHHWATTRSVLPQWLPGQQANKQQSTSTPKKVAILIAATVCQYNTACIAQWRRSRASLEATGCCHQASIVADRCNWSRICRFLVYFHCKLVEKGHGLRIRLLFSIWVWHIKRKRRA